MSLDCLSHGWEDFEREVKERLEKIFLYSVSIDNIINRYIKIIGHLQEVLSRVRSIEDIEKTAGAGELFRLLIGGLTEKGFTEYAYGGYMRYVWGIRLCTEKSCDERSVYATLVSEELGRLKVEVDQNTLQKLHSCIKRLRVLAERGLKMLGGTAPSSDAGQDVDIYEATRRLLEELTSFLPYTNCYAFLIFTMAQTTKEYVDAFLRKYCGQDIQCENNFFKIVSKIGAVDYQIFNVGMFGYPDNEKVLLGPPSDAELPETLGATLLGVIEIGLYLWQEIPRLRMYYKPRPDNPSVLFRNWIKDALKGYDFCGKVCRCGCNMELTHSDHVTICESRPYSVPLKYFIEKLAPCMFLRVVALERRGVGVRVKCRESICKFF